MDDLRITHVHKIIYVPWRFRIVILEHSTKFAKIYNQFGNEVKSIYPTTEDQVQTQSKVTDETAKADGVYHPKCWYRTPGCLYDLEDHRKTKFKIIQLLWWAHKKK